MLVYTVGFRSSVDLLEHFTKHGAEVGASNVDEYETMADLFLGGPLPPTAQECIRLCDNDLIRFEQYTDLYGVLQSAKIIRTLYKPIPCSSLPAGQQARFRKRRRCHQHASNLLYFQSECAK